MSFTLNMDTSELFQAMADLKGIPLEKVVRNASRDFVRGAKYNTPLAKISKSQFYKYFDQRDGKWHFLHESQVEEQYTSRTGKVKTRVRKSAKKQFGKLKKVRIAKGWSKYSWNGVMHTLGMDNEISSVPARLGDVSSLSEGRMLSTDSTSSFEISDYIHFDDFGKGGDRTSGGILSAGYARASNNMVKEVERMMRKAWKR